VHSSRLPCWRSALQSDERHLKEARCDGTEPLWLAENRNRRFQSVESGRTLFDRAASDAH
jgi:hypothetical protein